MKKESRYLFLQFQNVDGQQKTVLEILGKNTGVCYYRAIFINGNFQYSDFFVPIRNLTREGIACRLLKKTLKKMGKYLTK